MHFVHRREEKNAHRHYNRKKAKEEEEKNLLYISHRLVFNKTYVKGYRIGEQVKMVITNVDVNEKVKVIDNYAPITLRKIVSRIVTN